MPTTSARPPSGAASAVPAAGPVSRSTRVVMRISAIAATAQATPSSAKAGNCRNDTISVWPIRNAGKSPNHMRETMVPVTEAMTIGAKADSA